MTVSVRRGFDPGDTVSGPGTALVEAEKATSVTITVP